MHSSFALLLTTSLPFAGSAAAKDLWPKTGPSPVFLGKDRVSLSVAEPVAKLLAPAVLVQDTVAA